MDSQRYESSEEKKKPPSVRTWAVGTNRLENRIEMKAGTNLPTLRDLDLPIDPRAMMIRTVRALIIRARNNLSVNVHRQRYWQRNMQRAAR